MTWDTGKKNRNFPCILGAEHGADWFGTATTVSLVPGGGAGEAGDWGKKGGGEGGERSVKNLGEVGGRGRGGEISRGHEIFSGPGIRTGTAVSHWTWNRYV